MEKGFKTDVETKKGTGTFSLAILIRLCITFVCIKIIHSLINSLEFVEASKQVLFTNYMIIMILWTIASISMYRISKKLVIISNILVLLFVVSWFIGWNFLFEKVSNVLNKLWTRNINKLQTMFDKIFDELKGTIFNPISSTFTSMKSTLSSFFNNTLPTLLKPIGDGWSSFVSIMTQYILNPISDFFNAITDGFSSVYSSISDVFNNMYLSLLNNLYYPLRDSIHSFWSEFTSFGELYFGSSSSVCCTYRLIFK